MHIRASVATRSQHLGSPQVNKFEQVYSFDHQMSLLRGLCRVVLVQWDPMSYWDPPHHHWTEWRTRLKTLSSTTLLASGNKLVLILQAKQMFTLLEMKLSKMQTTHKYCWEIRICCRWLYLRRKSKSYTNGGTNCATMPLKYSSPMAKPVFWHSHLQGYVFILVLQNDHWFNYFEYLWQI